MSRAGIVSDPFRFASEERERSGVLALKDRVRLSDVLFGEQGKIEYSLVGEIGQDTKPYFRLKLKGTLGVQCQRCLERMEWPLELESLFQPGPRFRTKNWRSRTSMRSRRRRIWTCSH